VCGPSRGLKPEKRERSVEELVLLGGISALDGGEGRTTRKKGRLSDHHKEKEARISRRRFTIFIPRGGQRGRKKRCPEKKEIKDKVIDGK